MSGFQQRSLANNSTLGERLKQVRLDQHIELDVAAQHLKIRPDYLRAIEASDYTALPSAVFVRNYVRKYAKYLKLGSHATEELLEQELQVYETQVDIPTLKQHLNKRPLKIAHVLSAMAVVLAVLIVIAYFSFEVSNIVQPPEVTLDELPQQVTFDQRFINLAGQTVPGATVFINGQTVPVQEDGSFLQAVTLQTGVNLFKIVVKTKRSREYIEFQQIIVEEPL